MRKGKGKRPLEDGDRPARGPQLQLYLTKNKTRTQR
jgi:hypothetical protein